MSTSVSWIDFTTRLYNQNQFAIKLGLSSMKRALARSGRPDQRHKAILVAGTNGKGTTSCALAALLQLSGLRVGLYSSPHLVDLTERFRVNGAPLPRGEVESVGREVLEHFGEPDGEEAALTFFELTTLMAAKLFAQHEVDVAIYEVGLGGRLDATNAIEPSVSVVASIGFDHQQYLGFSLQEILGEKLGISRADKPLVIGAQDYQEVSVMVEELQHDELSFYGHSFRLGDESVIHQDHKIYSVTDWGPWHQLYQRQHWSLALCAASRFLGFPVADDVLDAALVTTRWPGRMDRLSLTHQESGHTYRFLFDAAHNPDGARVLFQALGHEDDEVTAVVCGAMKDKDLQGLWEPLTLECWQDLPIYGVVIDSQRAAGQEVLAKNLPRYRLIGRLDEVLSQIHEDGLLEKGGRVLVYGSLYLIGECLQYFGIGGDDLSIWQ